MKFDIEYKKTLKLLQELIKSGKETDKKIDKLQNLFDLRAKETDKKINQLTESGKDTDIRMKETDKMMKETDKKMKETDKKIDKLQNIIGGIGNSNGFVAEDFFYHSFSKKMKIGNMHFVYIDRNVYREHKKLKDEFDIVLTNTDSIVIVEVKYNYHSNDVKSVLKKINNYRILFPLYKNYKIFGAIAGLSIQPKAIEEAKKKGFFVVTQDGNNLKLLNDKVREYNLSLD